MMGKRRILIISSISPYKSANLGLDVITSLEKIGYEVDFMTQYILPSSKYISVKNEVEPEIPVPHKNPSFFKKVVSFICRDTKKKKVKASVPNENQFVIINSDEASPPIPPQLITDQIAKTYNFAIILFWQGMLTTFSIKSVYDKIKVPIFILAVDMFPFTGGCFYFWDCRRFINSSCGRCPGLDSNIENDSTRQCFNYKQFVYQNIECVFLGNKWMRSYIEQTPIVGGKPVRDILLVVDENVFRIREKKDLYKEFNLEGEEDSFVIFAGAPSLTEKRKGFTYLVQSINLFLQTLLDQERSKITLLLAGNPLHDLESYFNNIKVCELGFLDCERLAKAYSLANVYISPSIEDAGPSMVNQSIMSGVPVVAFDIGVAQDIVITGKTGYCAKTLDVTDLAKGICYIYSRSVEEQCIIQQNCRKLGIDKFSYAAFANQIREYDREFCQ